jgi:hypothetical protein
LVALDHRRVVFVDETGAHTSLAPLYTYSPRDNRAFFKVPRIRGGLFGENLGVEVAPIEYEDDGRRHRVRIGEFAEIEILDFVPPQIPEGEVSKLTGVFHPANSTLTMAQATTSRVNAFRLEFSNVGKNGHLAHFSWSG